MANFKSFAKIVDEAKTVLIDIKDNPSAVEPAIKECGRNIRLMNAALKTAKTIGEKQHVTTCISLMNGFRSMMKALRGVAGSGYKPTNPNRKNYTSLRVKWEDIQSAFAGRMRTGVVVNLKHIDPKEFLKDAQDMFRRRIKNTLKKINMVKVNAVFCGEFIIRKSDEEFYEFKHMNTKNSPIFHTTDINAWFEENVKQQILTQLEEFQEKDSGWSLSTIINICFNINKFTPQLGSSYIDLPPSIKLKHACINIQNDDDACFAWAVTAALHPVLCSKHPSRTSSYPHYSQILNLKNITMPMTIKQIPRFEAQNNMSINVYIIEKPRKKFHVVPTYLTKNKQAQHVNLLLLQDTYDETDVDDDSIPRFHYVWIKNLSRLVSSQLSRRNGQKFFCDRCLHYFNTRQRLDAHIEDCETLNECKVRLPKPEQAHVTFINHKNKEPTPFVIYADLECMLTPPSEEQLGKQSKTTIKLQEHKPYSAAYYVKCSYDETLSFFKSYRGNETQQWFAQEMKQFAEDVETIFLCPLSMDVLTPEQQAEFQSSSQCHICELNFNSNDIRVRDHCHLTGRFRGAAHDQCNLQYQDSHIIPVVFHNLSGYDSHFIIKNMAKDFDGRIDLLPINKERYISFTKTVDDNLIKFRFIDSFRFMNSGLDKLVSYLAEFPILKSQFLDLEESKFNLLTRKGVFPYDYIDSLSKLDEVHLPSQSKFHNSMTDTDISKADYMHACNVWSNFECKNLGEYSDLYLKSDVLLLADVFEQFRASCLKTYCLDPAKYYTLPGYTWDCMLKHTKINLELLTDIDMILFNERALRGGLSQVGKRYAEANNKYLPNYNPANPSKFLIYNDINNQYGWAMSQCLPYGGFEWLEGDFSNFNFNVPKDNSEGFLVEVSLEYPAAIHDSHSDLPFCPEHRAPPNSKEIKLMATLYDKERYVIHYRNLQQCLENGLKLKKIHRVLKFKQSPWLKPYIDLNTALRTAASNDFEKNLFKLMNNAVFGKTMENIRQHSIVKLVTKWEGRYGAEALISKPNFKSSTIFDQNLVAIELNKTEVFYNKPIYVGACILDISKLAIYDFHYSYMRSRFNEHAQLCYTDTDSLIYEVETDDLYNIIRLDAQNFFDTSDYPVDNIYGIPRVNKKVLGLMKDENAGRVMTKFAGLRSKMYSCQVHRTLDEELVIRRKMVLEGCNEHEILQALENLKSVKKVKGVKNHIVKNRITFDDYVNCLNDGKETIVQQRLFKSDHHDVSTIEQTKIALSPHDNKRYTIPGTYNTLAYGHWRIMT